MCSHFSHDQLFVTLRTVAYPVPLPMGFSSQEYWSGLLCLPPGDLPNLRIKPMSLTSPALAGRFFTTSTTWEIQKEYDTNPKLEETQGRYSMALVQVLRERGLQPTCHAQLPSQEAPLRATWDLQEVLRRCQTIGLRVDQFTS